MNNEKINDVYLATVGKRVQNTLKILGLSQNDVLEIADNKGYDIKQAVLSKICSGKISNPRAETLAQIADILNVSLNDLLSLDINMTSIPVKDLPTQRTSYTDPSDKNFITSPDNLHMKCYIKNFHTYFFPTKSDEDKIIKGKLAFERSEDNKKVLAHLQFKTGKKDDNGKEIEKHYYGELIISSFMSVAYCPLRSDDIGEISYLLFNYIPIAYEGLYCRVAMAITSCAGDPRVPTAHRIIISDPEISDEDLAIIKGQLYLNSREILISELGMEEMLKRKEIQDNQKIKELFQKNGSDMPNIGLRPIMYYRFEEAALRNSFLDSESKILLINLLRQYSAAPRYIKIGKKCDKFLYEFLTSRYGKK